MNGMNTPSWLFEFVHGPSRAHLSGVHHYEERLLFFMMLLRRPKTRVIYVTSQAISNPVVDYYLHFCLAFQPVTRQR